MPVRCGNRTAHGRVTAHHETVAQVKLCNLTRPVDSLEEQAGAGAWLAGASTHVETDQVEPEPCEHGLSASLCAGPGHYPADDPMNDRPATMAETSAHYHSMGMNCPWDCARCPGNIAADEYERSAELAAQADAAQRPDTSNSPGELRPSHPTAKVKHAPYDGIYTVETEAGHRTFKVRTQSKDDKFAPGQQIIGYLSGPDNESNYTNFGFVDYSATGAFIRVWSRFRDNSALLGDAEQFLADPDAALKVAHCYRCHRKLTVPASIHNGLGPECAKLVS